jgi:hypothetical protein
MNKFSFTCGGLHNNALLEPVVLPKTHEVEQQLKYLLLHMVSELQAHAITYWAHTGGNWSAFLNFESKGGLEYWVVLYLTVEQAAAGWHPQEKPG